MAVAPALELLDALLTGIQVVEDALLADFETAARERLATRDPDDWPALAFALALNAPVWTEDTDFFGTGVATWTTRNVEIYLGATRGDPSPRGCRAADAALDNLASVGHQSASMHRHQRDSGQRLDARWCRDV